MDILENKNIRLRAVEFSDSNLLYEWENDSELWHLGNTKVPFSKAVIKKYVESAHLDIYELKQLRLMIDLKDVETIGAVDLFDYDPYHSRAGVGILIKDVKHRERGYAFEALETLMNYARISIGIHQLYCNIGENNEGSLALFEKMGFIRVGLKKDWNKSINGWEGEYLLQYIYEN